MCGLVAEFTSQLAGMKDLKLITFAASCVCEYVTKMILRCTTHEQSRSRDPPISMNPKYSLDRLHMTLHNVV